MGNVLDECKSVSRSDASFTWASEDFLLRENVTAWTDMPLWLPEEAAPHLKGFMFISCEKAVSAGLSFRSLNDTIAATLTWYQTDRTNDQLKAGLTSDREQSLLRKLHAIR
jgi:2'-hydroxyisoflavone reductase